MTSLPNKPWLSPGIFVMIMNPPLFMRHTDHYLALESVRSYTLQNNLNLAHHHATLTHLWLSTDVHMVSPTIDTCFDYWPAMEAVRSHTVHHNLGLTRHLQQRPLILHICYDHRHMVEVLSYKPI